MKRDNNLYVGKLVQVKDRPFEHCHRIEWFYISAKVVEITERYVKVITEENKEIKKLHKGIYTARPVQLLVDHHRKEFSEEEVRECWKWYFDNGFVK